ncbi:MAG: hypothetical protein EOP04_14825 [Proteobacteria bacterium]|nr:MAG: hypothetical protein EOP04_14825 [Pseudomonadota bacterium]
MIRPILILIFAGSFYIANAQSIKSEVNIARKNFENKVRKADSLGSLKHFKKAFVIYKDQIDAILSGKLSHEVNANEWESLLRKAGDMGWKCSNTELAMSYNNMALGAKGEKLREKIEFLSQLDVNQYYIYKLSSPGIGHSLIVGGCSLSDISYLIWLHNGKCYIQRFDDCESYKPVQFTDTALYQLFDTYRKQITGEKIISLRVGYNHVPHYTIILPSDTGEVRKGFSINDISEYKVGSTEYSRLTEIKQLDHYLHNRQTKLKLLNEYSEALVDKYRRFLNSAAERKKVGKP